MNESLTVERPDIERGQRFARFCVVYSDQRRTAVLDDRAHVRASAGAQRGRHTGNQRGHLRA